MPATRPTQAAIRNALEAWKAAGLPVGRLTIGPRCEIIIEALPDAKESAQGRATRSAENVPDFNAALSRAGAHGDECGSMGYGASVPHGWRQR